MIGKKVRGLTGCWRAQCNTSTPKPCWLMEAGELGAGLDIYGFFLSEIGLGHTARLYHMAAAEAGLSTAAINRTLPGRQNDLRYRNQVQSVGHNRLCVTIDGLIGFKRISREICRQRFNIAFPLWELEKIPEHRQKHFSKFDALWAPSVFIRDILQHTMGRDVALIPHPILFPEIEAHKDGFTGPLRILFLFDFDSFPARKNPEGVVRAFQAAFPGKEDVLLTIKARGNQDLGRRRWLADQCQRDDRIRLIDETLPYDAVTALLKSHDVFLSLHRSEGFGLGCAEALAREKIVVATDYGGTCDFITEKTGFPVVWRRSPVGEGEYVEAEGATWANPSIEHAAHRLREIYDDPDMAKQRAIQGRDTLMKQHTLGEVGRRIMSVCETYGA